MDVNREMTPTSPSPSPPPSSIPKIQNSNPNITSGLAQFSNQSAPSTSNAVSNPSSFQPPPPPEDQSSSLPPSQAQIAENSRQELEVITLALVQSLYELAQCSNDITKGEERMIPGKINEIVETLAQLDSISHELPQQVPTEVLNLVDAGRNPDVHSRFFIGRLISDNQRMRGTTSSLYSYRSQLAEALASNFPDMKESIEQDQKVLMNLAGRSGKEEES